jgi:hypothetical protein
MARPDLVEILAHLDSAVGIPINNSLAASEAELYITKILRGLVKALGDRYTENQIRSRLREAFSQTELYPEYNFVQLFLHGSCKLALDPQTRTSIKEQLTLIRLQESTQERQLRPRAIAAPGRTRSQARRARRNAAKTSTGRGKNQQTKISVDKAAARSKVRKVIWNT